MRALRVGGEAQVDEARARRSRRSRCRPGPPAPRPASRRGRAAGPRPSSRCAARRWWRSRRARGCAAARRRRPSGSAARSRPRRVSTSDAAARTRSASRAGVTGSSLGGAAHGFSGAAPTLGAVSPATRGLDGPWSAARTARRCAARAPPSSRSGPRRGGMIAAVVVVVLFAGAIFGYCVSSNNAKQAESGRAGPVHAVGHQQGPVGQDRRHRHPAVRGRPTRTAEPDRRLHAQPAVRRHARRLLGGVQRRRLPAPRCAARTSCTRWSTARCGSPTTPTRSPATR